MKIGVIGNGVVGNATARCFMEHAEVRVFDVVKEKRTHSGDEVLECDIVFICLPEDALERQCIYLSNGWNDANLVIKSTCPIGTTRRLAEKYGLKNLVHSPEFLTARCAVTDAQLPARNIIGFKREQHTNFTVIPQGALILKGLYLKRFPGVPIHVMSSDESEAVKLFQNSFFAVKLAFFNEINELAEKLKLDWDVVLAAMLADGRIAHSHTKVPGPDGRYGFGGTCLPKDLQALNYLFLDSGLTADVCSAAISRNVSDRERSH